MQKKLILPLAAATALLIGFLIGFTVYEAPERDTFTVRGVRETEIHGAGYGGENRGKIDINTASETELADLPGIGPVLAGRIAAFREEYGPFGSADELLGVSGIGEKTLENMLPYIYIP